MDFIMQQKTKMATIFWVVVGCIIGCSIALIIPKFHIPLKKLNNGEGVSMAFDRCVDVLQRISPQAINSRREFVISRFLDESQQKGWYLRSQGFSLQNPKQPIIGDMYWVIVYDDGKISSGSGI
jgi:hypothetical protein